MRQINLIHWKMCEQMFNASIDISKVEVNMHLMAAIWSLIIWKRCKQLDLSLGFIAHRRNRMESGIFISNEFALRGSIWRIKLNNAIWKCEITKSLNPYVNNRHNSKKKHNQTSFFLFCIYFKFCHVKTRLINANCCCEPTKKRRATTRTKLEKFINFTFAFIYNKG